MSVVVAVYLVAANLAGWGAFAWDKLRARDGLWRVPERTLLTIAAIGGSPGAILAMRTLRHKTRKQPFGTWMRVIVAIQVLALVGLGIPQAREFALRLVEQILSGAR